MLAVRFTRTVLASRAIYVGRPDFIKKPFTTNHPNRAGINVPATGAFRPPALADDMTTSTKKKWSDRVNNMFERSSGSGGRADRKRKQWFNPLTCTVSGFEAKSIEWNAFPKQVLLRNAPRGAWKEADFTRDVQDEYCEWAVTKDEMGKIIRVDFTAEGPEYFDTLAKEQPDTLLALYRQFVSPNVQMHDLLSANGSYIMRNKWNNATVDGRVMHLIQENNTLGAEVELAASATVIRRRKSGEDITSEQELAMCTGNGNINRHSDPHISAEVNALARAGYLVCLADPVGLYIKNFLPRGFVTPDGSNAAEFFVADRGSGVNILRARFEVPASKGYTVSDITIKGEPIQFGGQIAQFINIHLMGIAVDRNISNRDPVDTCGYL